MRIAQYQIDAFTRELFRGNPAAVCVLSEWPADSLMQQIAAENNLSETAFIVPVQGGFQIRWFTPVVVVDLCGHATLAAAWVVRNKLEYEHDTINFVSSSGLLQITAVGDTFLMDFPAMPPMVKAAPPGLLEALGVSLNSPVLFNTDYVVVLENEAQVAALKPDMARLAEIETRGVIVTAPGDEVDFVSRFFAPRVGVNEDPVTGSAHCALVPYWAKQTGKQVFAARQISPRGGELSCQLGGERVMLAGQAVLFSESELHLADA